MRKTRASLVQAAAMAVAVGLGSVATVAGATATEIDFSAMTGAVSTAAVVTAIVSFGAIKLAPNFTRWAVNKVASFF
jgi:hypothetical protein